jgi:predicted alpha/beta-fold hydrolase
MAHRLARERVEAPVLLVGVSLGGNVVVKWLAELGSVSPPWLLAAVAISTPFDLASCAQSLDGPGFWPLVYRQRFLRTLVRKAREKSSRFPAKLPASRLRRLSALRTFDDQVTGPVHGFAGADDYYAQSSSGPLISRVRVPLLLLSASDDPFIPPSALPIGAARANPAVTLELTNKGGHVGFIAGPPWRPRYYAEERAGEWLAQQFEREGSQAASTPGTTRETR